MPFVYPSYIALSVIPYYRTIHHYVVFPQQVEDSILDSPRVDVALHMYSAIESIIFPFLTFEEVKAIKEFVGIHASSREIASGCNGMRSRLEVFVRGY